MGNNSSKAAGEGPTSPTTTTHGHPPRSHQQRKELPTPRESLQSSSTYPSNSNSLDSANVLTPQTSQSSSSPAIQKSSSNPHQSHQSVSTESPPGQHSKKDEKMGNAHSHQSWKDKTEHRRREREHEHPSNPVRVPGVSQEKRQRGPDSQFEPSGPPRDPNFIPHSNLHFPPRLPLPIQEEVYTPGSPIISPADVSSALHEDEVDGILPRKSSITSHTTLEDDDLEDELPEGAKGKTVPTLVEWRQGGDKVYITGTFASWSRKYRMHRE